MYVCICWLVRLVVLSSLAALMLPANEALVITLRAFLCVARDHDYYAVRPTYSEARSGKCASMHGSAAPNVTALLPKVERICLLRSPVEISRELSMSADDSRTNSSLTVIVTVTYRDRHGNIVGSPVSLLQLLPFRVRDCL
jgi:hypothetical protein